MDSKEIIEKLKSEALRFCMQFFPHGKRVGILWEASDILDSKKGKSFKVYIDGARKGYWIENGEPACIVGKNGGKNGSLIDVIMAQRGYSFPEALKFVTDWLGIVDNISPAYVKDKPTRNPDYISKKHLFPITEDSRAYKYLCEERSIPIEILKKYRVCQCMRWFREFNKEVESIAFPIYSGRGDEAKLLNIKYLALDRVDGKKLCSQEKGGICALFGWQAIEDDTREIVICEGEIDAMTLSLLGYNALSVPEGAHADGKDGKVNKANEWINTDWEKLEKYETIKVCMDSDEPGQSAAQTILQRLGIHRTELVEIPLPYKDPNEMLIDGETDKLTYAVENAQAQDPKELAHAIQFAQQLKDRLDGKSRIIGRSLPWNLGDHFKIRDYELSIVSGYSGHGKTAWLNDLMVNLCSAGETCCIASLEVPIASTMESLFRQCTGRRNYFEKNGYVVPDLFDNAMAWLNERFFFFNHVGRVVVDDVLRTFQYCFRRYGTRLFVVDSLMCCDVCEDDKEGQKTVMQKFVNFAMENGVHIFLVAHSKKPSEKKNEAANVPGKHDVNGSVHITDLAHNVIIVWRAIQKESLIEDAKAKRDWSEVRNIEAMHDGSVYIKKQREGSGALPKKDLWFDLDSRQFRDSKEAPIRHFVQGSPFIPTIE